MDSIVAAGNLEAFASRYFNTYKSQSEKEFDLALARNSFIKSKVTCKGQFEITVSVST